MPPKKSGKPIELIEKQRKEEKQTIIQLIQQAKLQWQESMDTLKNPGIPKTEQMKIDLANTCAGLEEKIAMLEKDLDTPANEEEEDEITQYQIYTLLPDLIDNWSKLSFNTRLKFVGALTRKVIISHPAPVWLKMAILWKRPEWGID